MTTWNDRLVIGTASNMFMPDLLSDPYTQMTLDESIALLRAQGFGPVADWLGSMDLDAQLPYIGAEVYISNSVTAVPVPSSLILVGLGLASLRHRCRRRRW
jgi:hypothetical protein